jgi:type IV pilus assembly protein PilW
MKSRSQSGLTLIELMIAMLLGLLVIAAVGSMFLASSRSYRQDERVSVMSDELRVAVGEIARDLEMAGFWGTIIDPDALKAPPSFASFKDAVVDCDGSSPVFLDPGQPVQAINAADATAIAAVFDCISDALPGTGAISTNRVAGTPVALSAVKAGQGYLQTTGGEGMLYVASADAAPPASGTGVCSDPALASCQYWQYRPSVYYIRNWSVSAGDGIPSLCRKRLTPSAGQLRPVSECTSTGIEDLHVEFGVDTDRDSSANLFTSTPTAAQMGTLNVLRVHLLARAQRGENSHTSEKTYVLGDKTVAPAMDSFYRRTASMSVVLRNPTSQRALR